MAQHNWLFAMPGRVSEHLVALTAASGIEPYGHHLIESLGEMRHWSNAALIVVTAVVYIAGLLTAAFIRRRWLRRRRLIELPQVFMPVLPAVRRARQRRKTILLATASVAAVGALIVFRRIAASRSS